MARNPNYIHALVTLTVAGDKSSAVSNGWNFRFNGSLDPTPTDWTNLTNALIAFYTSPGTGSHGLMYYMGPALIGGAGLGEVALYQIDPADPHHYFGSPVNAVPFDQFNNTGTAAMPNEVAAAVSIRAGYGTDPEHSGSTRPRSSDRGRVYIGPLGQVAIGQVTLPDGGIYANLASVFTTQLKTSLLALFDTAGSHQWVMSVFSRKEGLLKDVQYYAIDQYVDSQRKRGVRDPLQTWVVFT